MNQAAVCQECRAELIIKWILNPEKMDSKRMLLSEMWPIPVMVLATGEKLTVLFL